MAVYDANRPQHGATGIAGQIGTIFVSGFAPLSVNDTPRAGFAGTIGGAFRTLFATIADWNDARLTRKSLEALTDRELDDIGLCRGDIDRIAHLR
ncbi:DUF1127 domain-containing protein [Salipiger marinus]|jgi:uncharacterized protein YjiS (DUF1127 family)|uniref:YjiS-like domain-containing protein n=1 Tax=Salipiger marinus TaxID=555512 RepID=A0A1G8Q4T7_9RHOB|nr:DUF1127 domain-containing protein [Salipiger manganoxidans]SDI99764.1 protein of unknown function [Salipiger marinus]HBM61489.1 DUF1127 domain-containing protein [Citreicella sp.]HBT02669.1 DUF1127 domain-containing protein [Citreicella sp.]|tara:strand:+ start:121 stop:405 length:285 start_codon:yes stop_codon:yes gene_type:complete